MAYFPGCVPRIPLALVPPLSTFMPSMMPSRALPAALACRPTQVAASPAEAL